MTRRRRLGLTGIAGLLALLLGSGLIAVVSDSVRSNGNSAEAGTYTAAHDLKAARSNSFSDCTTEDYTDGPFTAAIETTIDLQSVSTSRSSHDFCLKNDGLGRVTGKLTATLVNVADSELGGCETSESDGGGDGTCGAGAPGELKPVLGAVWRSCQLGGGTCNAIHGPAAFGLFEVPLVLDAAFEPGEKVRVHLALWWDSNGSNEQAKLRAQTDRLQWDIVFTLEDVPAA